MESAVVDIDVELTKNIRGLVPFAEVLGLEMVRATPEEAVCRVEWKPERCTSAGILHGGYLMAVVDTLGAVCAVQNLPPGAGTSTIESKTNFLRAVRGGAVTVRSAPVHVGRTTIVLQTDVTDEAGKLVMRSTQTQAVLAASG
jgi:1,4-dihydroxy-2-naphthoyl-CoA hydrolase